MECYESCRAAAKVEEESSSAIQLPPRQDNKLEPSNTVIEIISAGLHHAVIGWQGLWFPVSRTQLELNTHPEEWRDGTENRFMASPLSNPNE
jgi:hypothetical protein